MRTQPHDLAVRPMRTGTTANNTSFEKTNGLLQAAMKAAECRKQLNESGKQDPQTGSEPVLGEHAAHHCQASMQASKHDKVIYHTALQSHALFDCSGICLIWSALT